MPGTPSGRRGSRPRRTRRREGPPSRSPWRSHAATAPPPNSRPFAARNAATGAAHRWRHAWTDATPKKRRQLASWSAESFARGTHPNAAMSRRGSSSSHLASSRRSRRARRASCAARYRASRRSQKAAVEPSTVSNRDAASGVTLARPWTKSFTCLRVKPSRSASSACVQPRSSSASAMVSPGGEVQSGAKLAAGQRRTVHREASPAAPGVRPCPAPFGVDRDDEDGKEGG